MLNLLSGVSFRVADLTRSLAIVRFHMLFTRNAIKIIFMSLTICFRIHGKIVKSIDMDVRWMAVALRAILGNGSSSLLSSLFSSLDIQFNANR